jgi:hypothetical protein
MTKRQRTWRLRVAFEPNRFASEQLVKVYEQLEPMRARTTQAAPVRKTAVTKRSTVKGGEQ